MVHLPAIAVGNTMVSRNEVLDQQGHRKSWRSGNDMESFPAKIDEADRTNVSEAHAEDAIHDRMTREARKSKKPIRKSRKRSF
jgi:hypothetical protein